MTDEEYKIFDFVIECEDKYFLNVREHVLNDTVNKFGELGRKVVTEYYNRVDGVEEDSSDKITKETECKECEEKRKELSLNLSMIDSITKCTQSYAYDFVKNTITQDDIDCINFVIDGIITKFNKKTLYEYNKNDIVKSIIIQLLQKKENESDNTAK